MQMFQNKEIDAFWKKNESYFPKNEFRYLILEILAELDDPKENLTPSVVDLFPCESKPGITTKDFEIYRQIPLWRHSINTAIEIIAMEKRENGSFFKLFWVAIISALLHDFAKLKYYRNSNYSSSEHAEVGARIAYTLIHGKLSERHVDMIVHAIRYHHTPTKQDHLTELVSRADKRAREKELLYFIRNSNVDKSSSIANFYFNKSIGSIPWFDFTYFTQLMKSEINKYRSPNKFAFSYQDEVFATIEIVWDVINKIAENNDEAGEYILEDFRKIAWVMTQWIYLLEESNAVSFHNNLPGYAGSPYCLKIKGESAPQTAYLIAFNQDIFAMDHSHAESYKPLKIKNILSVTPGWIVESA